MNSANGSTVQAPRRAPGGGTDGVPRRAPRVWQFIVVPAAGMALLIVLFRWLDHALGGSSGFAGSDLYQIIRAAVISLTMVSIIAWLVIRHRSEYEARLQKRSDDLEATRDFLSNVIESSGEALITLDAEDRVTSWNRAATGIFGWTTEEMLGRSLDRLLPDGSKYEKEKHRDAREIRAGRSLRHYETERVRKDGELVTVHITHSPLYGPDGTYVGSTVFSHDVTAIKELSARLQEQERLAALGELAAAVAHEVKNPLAGIRGACDILARGYDENDRRRELGEEVIRQVDRLHQSIRDLLVFAKPKAKKPAPTDIHLILDRVMTMMRKDPECGRAEVTLRYDRELPPLNVDPQQIEQVFFNIFINACQAMDHEGKVTVTTERDGGYARVRVRDSGPGIPQEAVDRVFEPFFTTRARGTGLGLAIVRNIVGEHDGTVAVDSPPEGGTEVSVTLPIHT